MSQNSKPQEALSKIRTYKEAIHPDFEWWKEREEVDERSYVCLRPTESGKSIAPPEHVLRTLDQFESLLNWLETKSIGEEMTAYERAQVALKLLDATSARDLSVSLKNTYFDVDLQNKSFDVNLQGDLEWPMRVKVEGGYGGNPIVIEKSDS